MHTWMILPRISFVGSVLAAIAVFGAAVCALGQEQIAVYRINAGGPAVGSYSKDAYFDGGSIFTNNDTADSTSVAQPPPAQVYQTQRYGDFTYTFPNLKPGTNYLVRLHFAEIYFVKGREGARVFNVSINDSIVLARLDILAAAGAKDLAFVKEFVATPDAKGTIRVGFHTVIRNATVNAIEIVQGAFPGVPTVAQAAAAPQVRPATNISTPQTGGPTPAQEDNGRITRLSEIAHDLEDPRSNTAALLTEAARGCGFAIWKEDRTPIAAPTGPPLHLAVTDAEIERFSIMFRNGQSVALSDLINSVDYVYKDLGDGGSSRADVLAWLNTGDQSENASVRALTTFLKYRNDFKAATKATDFNDPNVQLDPIQALLILRVVTEEIAFPILHAATRAGRPSVERSGHDFAIIPANYSAAPLRDVCGEEGKDWAEDLFSGGITRLWEHVVHHAGGHLASGLLGGANTLISLIKFISTYGLLKMEMHVDAPGQPLIRTKDTRGPGDGPRTVVAKFSIDGVKLSDWLKENRCALVLATTGALDFDLPKTKPLAGIETSWRVDQSDDPKKQIIWKATDMDQNGQRTGQQSLDRVLTDENGDAKVAWDGAPQPKKLPEKVVPYHRYVEIYVTPQAKNPEAKQDLVDAILAVAGIKNGPAGVLTPIFEELYRLKWKGTAHMNLMVRDWRPEGPDEYSGGMTIFLTASGHEFRKEFAYKMNLDRTLEFIETKMGMISGDMTQVDPDTLSRLPPAMRQTAETELRNVSGGGKKITFLGFGPGKLSMTVNDDSFLRTTVSDCEMSQQSEKTSTVNGPKDGSPKEFAFGPIMPPGLTIFSVEVDLEKKIAIIKGDYALPVNVKSVTIADGKTTTTNKDSTRTIFQQLTPQAPFSPNGIIVPIEVRSLDEEIAAVDATGISYSGKVTIPFTFGKYTGNAYLTFYIKKIVRSQ